MLSVGFGHTVLTLPLSRATMRAQEQYASALRRNNQSKLKWGTGVAFGSHDAPERLSPVGRSMQ
jgi:hypothetical protein